MREGVRGTVCIFVDVTCFGDVEGVDEWGLEGKGVVL